MSKNKNKNKKKNKVINEWYESSKNEINKKQYNYLMESKGFWVDVDKLEKHLQTSRPGRWQYLTTKSDDWYEEIKDNKVVLDLIDKYISTETMNTHVLYILFMSIEKCRDEWVKMFDKNIYEGHYQPSDLHDLALMPWFTKLLGEEVYGLELIEEYNLVNFHQLHGHFLKQAS